MKITDISLKNKTGVFVLLFLIVVGGFVSYVNLPIESFPDITQPVVIVSVSYLGVAPADMDEAGRAVRSETTAQSLTIR